MQTANINSRWNEVKGRLKQQFEMLSDDDLALRFGHEGDLIGRLQKKLGKTKADILRIIAEA
ncbi:MAG TPA: general stress protein CsbD [Chryseosolibacter sp.]|nr:general stress protein CsbD [Chryseosolibacter sp.]